MNEVIQKTIQIEENKEYVFRNQVDFCIGTGRMGLALTKEYQDQLALVQKEIGFSHIRGPVSYTHLTLPTKLEV